ncbi:hypothetical protein M3B43_07455 [Nesterenkonia massiliensis]|uniref:Uncharacterized protein n=1 Tax=Nesterenkonia massiliensis TaxID=1232429 RepID=A0ABT2HR34_9MICC|nr:hypothetical protein [Nesterenkonia massiliensis]MCT1607164.1 hypothetical protein [Nesterenkonia massiliensis]
MAVMETREVAEQLRDLVLPSIPDEDLDYFEAAAEEEDWAHLAQLSREAAQAYGVDLPTELIAA